MSRPAKKLACILQCNNSLNRKAICIKRSWDEVAAILDKACARKKGSCCKKS